MLDMQAFHKKLSTSPRTQKPYIKALADLSNISLPTLKSITDNLGWQIWESPTSKLIQG